MGSTLAARHAGMAEAIAGYNGQQQGSEKEHEGIARVSAGQLLEEGAYGEGEAQTNSNAGGHTH